VCLKGLAGDGKAPSGKREAEETELSEDIYKESKINPSHCKYEGDCAKNTDRDWGKSIRRNPILIRTEGSTYLVHE